MRSRHLFGIMLAGLTVIATSTTGCGGDTKTTSTGGNGGGGAGGGGEVLPSVAGCKAAATYTLGAMTDAMGELNPVATERDYIKVDLKKGQTVFLGANSKPADDPYGEAYPDLVMTLFSGDGTTQIAQNDDGATSNNSELYYIVPEDATYCVEITECFVMFGADVCSDPALITKFSYTFGGFEINPDQPLVTVDKEPNESAPEATPINLVKFPDPPQPTLGYQSVMWGGFSSATDKDVFSFTAQSDFQVEADGRPLCIFSFYQAGIEGNGSTADMNVLAEVATKAAPDAIIAQANVQLWDYTFGYPELPTITMPCTKGTEYVLKMSRSPGATVAKNDFYFFEHYQYSSNTKEIEPNDASPQPLQTSATSDGTGQVTSVTGDILKSGDGGDKDTFEVNVPAGLGLASAVCSAQREGSGLRGLQVSLLDDKGNFLQNGSGIEGEDHIVYIDSARIPAGATTVTMEVVSGDQDPNVSGKWYTCTLLLNPN